MKMNFLKHNKVKFERVWSILVELRNLNEKAYAVT